MYFNMMKIRDIEDFRKVSHLCLYLPRWTQCTPNSLWCVEENRQRSAQAMCLRRHSRVGSHAPSHHEWHVHTSICVHAHPFWRKSMRPWLPFHPSTSRGVQTLRGMRARHASRVGKSSEATSTWTIAKQFRATSSKTRRVILQLRRSPRGEDNSLQRPNCTKH